MIGALAKRLFGSANDRFVKTLRNRVEAIGSLEPELEALSDDELKARTDWFRGRLNEGESLDDVLDDAFATVREAAKRTIGQRPFDTQLIGGLVLHQGKIAEMKTGEGKTLAATLAVYLNAIEGKGVHVVTVNDYLARRDSEWMGEIYRFLGLTVGCIVPNLGEPERKAAYAADITYGTNNEFGFDYLRDNMKFEPERMVQRAFNFAIVDEVDSILVDEARTPLIISGPAETSSELYQTVDTYIPKLEPDDYEKDEKQRAVSLSESGRGADARNGSLKREGPLITSGSNSTTSHNVNLVHHVNQALRAHHAVHSATSRLHRQERQGHHHRRIHRPHDGRPALFRRPASGARGQGTGCTIQPENQTLASITFQNYFRLYDEAGRHDRHGGDRGRPSSSDIYKPRRRRDSDQSVPVSRDGRR